MEIKTKLRQQDVIAVSLRQLYRSNLKYVFGFLVLSSVYFSIDSLLNKGSIQFSDFSSPLIVFVVLTTLTVISVIINFRANQRIRETIEYKFGEDELHIKGESFSSQCTWNKVRKVTISKNWLLIWQSRQLYNIIPRRDVFEGDILHLKEILARHNVKNNL